MRKGLMALTLTIGFAIWVGAAQAGPGWGMGPGPGPMGGDYSRLSSYLGLTQEQEAQIRALREKHQSEMAPLGQQLFTKRQELRLLWSDPATDPEKIMAKQKEISEIHSQMQELFVKHWLDVRSLLTPEQIRKLSVMRGPGPMGGLGKRWGCGPWSW